MSTIDEDTLRTPAGDEHQDTPAVVSQDDTSTRGMVLSGDKLVFSPPLYVQRYQAVQEIITTAKMPVTKVVDIGSAELKFFRNLRYINGVQEVVLVDIDEETLQNCKHRVKPLMADFLLRRQEPLTVKVVCGDARLYDPLLSGAQVVTLIEVIEHMNECDLPALVQCVFQHVRPHLVVVTTPNADFNKFFPNHTPGKFRHWDHKFEWTAEEFQQWCLGVVEEYQDYTVEFSGCGLGPDGTYCSQVATFWHHTQYQEHSEPLMRTNMTATALGEAGDPPHTPATENIYKIIEEFEFPVDKRTKEEWEADYAINSFNSLRNFLVSRDRSSLESSVPVWHLQDTALGLLSAPPDGSLSPDCSHYLTPHFDNEEAVYKAQDMKNDYCFYIIDNRYALIPIRSLAQWVNSGAETDLTDELISQVVEEECFETHGSGASWMGKMRLYEDSVSSSSSRVRESDSGEDTSYTKWPSMEALQHITSDHSKDKEDKLQSDGFKNYLECWD